MSLHTALQKHFDSKQYSTDVQQTPILNCSKKTLLSTAKKLKTHKEFQCDMLMDIAGIDYLHYGKSEWETTQGTSSSYSRARSSQSTIAWDQPRFAVIYQLLSTHKNHRIRLKVALEESDLRLPSLVDVWNSANWYEREAFDLFGFFFDGHPDLRRILTDYGFSGHPFRKDFPLSGKVEMRYDATTERCIYEPVKIQRRVVIPKVIRHDNRYLQSNTEEKKSHD
jgi:NADH-quinone oxidoreductase subunit C